MTGLCPRARLIAPGNLRDMLRRRLRDHTGQPLSLSEQEARALLAKYGTDDGGLLPYEVCLPRAPERRPTA